MIFSTLTQKGNHITVNSFLFIKMQKKYNNMNFLFHSFSGKLCNPADCHINLTDFIPCGKVHFPGLR